MYLCRIAESRAAVQRVDGIGGAAGDVFSGYGIQPGHALCRARAANEIAKIHVKLDVELRLEEVNPVR